MLQPLGVRLVGLALVGAEAWQLQSLDNGMTIVLGRATTRNKSPLMERLRRFIAVWPRPSKQIDIDIKTADLRYAGGFALPGSPRCSRQPVGPPNRKAGNGQQYNELIVGLDIGTSRSPAWSPR